MQTATAPTTEEGLQRALTRWHALAIVVSLVIGTSIFIRPASIAQLVQSPRWIMLVWIAAGLLSILGAITYADLAARIPRSGGEYAFLRVTLGELPAFLFGWMRLTVGSTTIGFLAVAFSVFLGDLVHLGGSWWVIHLPASAQHVTVDIGARQLIAVLVIMLLAMLNVRGVGRAGQFQIWVTTLKVTGLIALILAIVIAGHSSSSGPGETATPSGVDVGLSAFSAAMLASMGAYSGWEKVVMVGGEVRDPGRSLPWALIIGIGAATLIYLGANLAYLHVLSLPEIITANSSAHPNASSVASRAAAAALGPHAGAILTMLFLVSALGTLHCNLLTMPRLFFAMARDRLLPGPLSRLAPRAHTPDVAIKTLATIGAVLAVLGGYDRLANMGSIGILMFNALNAAGYIYARHRLPLVTNRLRVPLAIPIIFLVAVTGLIVTIIARGMIEVTAALVLISLGVPVFIVMRFALRR